MYITSLQIKNKTLLLNKQSHKYFNCIFSLSNGKKFGGKDVKYYPTSYFKEKYLYPYPNYVTFLQNDAIEEPNDIPDHLNRRELNCGSTFEPNNSNHTQFPCYNYKNNCLKNDNTYLPRII